MTLLFSESKRFSNLVKYELWPAMAYTRLVVTYNGTAGNLLIGTVLGKVTANSKYKVAIQTAVDGSQNADAILIEDKTVPLNTDTKLLVLARGPAIVSQAALILDATYDLQAEKDLVYSQLEAKGIQVNSAV